MSVRINAYIDGFNLYFGCLENTPYRWLDPRRLCAHLLDPLFPDYDLNLVRYFTARIEPRSNGDEGPARQATYLEALGTLPGLSIHEGQFKRREKSYPLVDGTGFANVFRDEEKGSDVNLATFLLIDAIDDCYDVALVISNDTGLVLPISLVRKRIAVAVGISAPAYFGNRKPHLALEAVSDFKAHILKRNKGCLRDSQFPQLVTLVDGRSLQAPDGWTRAQS